MLNIKRVANAWLTTLLKTRSPYVKGAVARTPFLGHSVSNSLDKADIVS